MILYSVRGVNSLLLPFRLKGSVFPNALLWGIPNGVAAYFVHKFIREQLAIFEGYDQIWSGFTVLLGFLIAFRNSLSHTRFWEAATLMHQTQGEWMNAVSSLVAFCSQAEEKRRDVLEFQQLLMRLMSMLHCQALQKICDLQDDSFEILDLRGFDEASLAFLARVDDRCGVLLQWIQRIVLDADACDTIAVDPPVLSRAFQELSRGIVNLHNLCKVKEVPFPFPYAQILHMMIMVHSIILPFLTSYFVGNRMLTVFIVVFITTSQWSLLYIPQELDHPFGEDENDFNMNDMQHAMNRTLLTLLHPLAQQSPGLPRSMHRDLSLVQSNTHIRSLQSMAGSSQSGTTTTGLMQTQETMTRSMLNEVRDSAATSARDTTRSRVTIASGRESYEATSMDTDDFPPSPIIMYPGSRGERSGDKYKPKSQRQSNRESFANKLRFSRGYKRRDGSSRWGDSDVSRDVRDSDPAMEASMTGLGLRRTDSGMAPSTSFGRWRDAMDAGARESARHSAAIASIDSECIPKRQQISFASARSALFAAAAAKSGSGAALNAAGAEECHQMSAASSRGAPAMDALLSARSSTPSQSHANCVKRLRHATDASPAGSEEADWESERRHAGPTHIGSTTMGAQAPGAQSSERADSDVIDEDPCSC